MTTETGTARDPEGYLIDPERWNPSAAQTLAEEEGIRLDEAHWPVLHFMRSYWTRNRVAPDVRHVVDYLIKEQGHDDKKSAKNHLYRLFPYGYVKQACKIAGMQRPRAWSTG
ncbi:MAG: TusE/DsrC/DsvC family sulfur relay protein [Thiogranum sp.]|nr:TusE/DsrC/DsvC family sulfur relay protein [Thiogranum sp.]